MQAIRSARFVLLGALILLAAIPSAQYFAARFDVDGLLPK